MGKVLQQPKGKKVVPKWGVSPSNLRYGMLVEFDTKDGGYHSGVKVHFWNEKGVLVGNYYQFVPFERIRLRTGENRQYERFFMNKRFEKTRMFLFKIVLSITQMLVCYTQKKMN